MPVQESKWASFWKAERHAFDDVMRLATGYFADRFVREFDVRAHQHVFDYGCGPGFLADALIPQGIIFSGADINEYFIDICRQRHATSRFFHIQTTAAKNTEMLATGMSTKPDFIILLSISQYLASPQDLGDIISLVVQFLKPGGSVIVADVIDEDTKSYRDALALLYHTLRKGRPAAFVRFIRYVLSSEYARVSKATTLLRIPEAFMREVAAQNGLTCRRVNGLTFHPTRKNYVFQRQTT